MLKFEFELDYLAWFLVLISDGVTEDKLQMFDGAFLIKMYDF